MSVVLYLCYCVQPVQSSVVILPAQPRPTADPKQDEKSKKRLVTVFPHHFDCIVASVGTRECLDSFRALCVSSKTMKRLPKQQKRYNTITNLFSSLVEHCAWIFSTDIYSLSSQERRRSEIEDKVTKTEEIKKEEAEFERKELYNQQRAQRSKVATIAKQMDIINSVGVTWLCVPLWNILELANLILFFFYLFCSTQNGMTMTESWKATLRPRPSLPFSIYPRSTHLRLRSCLLRQRKRLKVSYRGLLKSICVSMIIAPHITLRKPLIMLYVHTHIRNVQM